MVCAGPHHLLRVMALFCLLPGWCIADSVTFLVADGTVEPYQIIRADSQISQHSGILTDILTLVLQNSGVQLNFVVRPYKRIKTDILAQRHTSWVSYGSPSWMDARMMIWGEYTRQPIMQTHYVLVSLRHPVVPDLNHIRDQKIIVILGYDYSPDFKQWADGQGVTRVNAPSHRHALAMLKQGRGDFYLAEDVRVRWEARRAKMALDDLHLIDFSSVIPSSALFLLLDKQMPPKTREYINHRLSELAEQGKIDEIIRRYQ